MQTNDQQVVIICSEPIIQFSLNPVDPMPKRYFERLQTIDYLIRIKGTGNPSQLAKRLNISERTLYEFLRMMKDLGAPIEYDRYKESYYYGEKGGFNIKFTKSVAAASPLVLLLSSVFTLTCL